MNRRESSPYGKSIDHLKLGESQKRMIYLKRTLPKDAEEENLLEGLRQTIIKNGTRRTLTQLHAHNLLRFFVDQIRGRSRQSPSRGQFEMAAADDPGLPPRLIQFGAGFAFQIDAETSEELPFKEIADSLLQLLGWYSRHSPRSLERWRADPTFGLLYREITTFRHAAGEQVLEKSYRVYKPWETEMEELLGFSIEDAIYYHDKIVQLFSDNQREAAEEIGQWTDSFLEFPDKALEITEKAVWLERNEIIESCDSSDRFQNLLDRLSASVGSPRGFMKPSEINPLEQTPFIKSGNEILAPFPRTTVFSLAKTFFYDFMDSEYSGNFQYKYGDWLEDWTHDCLSKIFDRQNIVRNYFYEYQGETVEGDILLRTGRELVVIECKAKQLTAATRRGNLGGSEDIVEDVEKGIGEAYSQISRTVEAVKSGALEEVENDCGDLMNIDNTQIEQIHRIVLLGESYGNIATRDFAKILDISPVPYVCDIFDLEIICEVLDTDTEFLQYVEERKKMTAHQLRNKSSSYAYKKIFASDEIDYLAVFNRNDCNFPDYSKNITGAGDGLREDSVDAIRERGEFKHFYE